MNDELIFKLNKIINYVGSFSKNNRKRRTNSWN